MSAKTVSALKGDARELLRAAKSIYDLGDEATVEQLNEAAAKTADAEKIEAELAKLGTGEAIKTAEALADRLATLDRIERPVIGGAPAVRGHDGAGIDRRGVAGAIKSAGEQFITDDAFARWLKSIAPNGHIPKQHFTSPPVEVKTILYAGGATSGGPMVWTDQRRDLIVDTVPMRPITVLDLVTRLPTNSDAIEYVRITGRTNNAAPVAEATATSGSTGAKPESAMALAVVTETVKTIAHWIPATTRLLQDAPQLRALIDAFLRDGIQEELEDQILTGDGTGENFTGINNTTGTLTEAYDTGLLKTARKARTTLMVDGDDRPTAWVMHPNDWEAFDLLVDNETRYYFGGPLVMGTPRLWGIPVVESEGQTEGSSLLGNFRRAVIFDRQQTSITVGNQHADFFIRNMVAILAEGRYGFGVLKPSSFVEVDLTA